MSACLIKKIVVHVAKAPASLQEDRLLSSDLGCGNILPTSQSDKREKINLLSGVRVLLEDVLEMTSVLSG